MLRLQSSRAPALRFRLALSCSGDRVPCAPPGCGGTSEKSAETSGDRPRGGKGRPWGLSAGSEALTELHKRSGASEKKKKFMVFYL